MKKNKHITINLTEEEYKEVAKIANDSRRPIADVARLLLIDQLYDLIAKNHDGGSSEMKKAHFYK